MQKDAFVEDASDLYLIESKNVKSNFFDFLNVLMLFILIFFSDLKSGKRLLI